MIILGQEFVGCWQKLKMAFELGHNSKQFEVWGRASANSDEEGTRLSSATEPYELIVLFGEVSGHRDHAMSRYSGMACRTEGRGNLVNQGSLMIRSSTSSPSYASFSLRLVNGAPIRNLHREVDDLSERLSQLLATIDADSPEAAIIRSLIM
ncbi:hypothetical protein SADUNF_Sadunf17G0081300 [Salix dunnii]|uniref:Uncharacterized protein n=1 Tax=Salix dunnii TaxID=1413687 RepID=A0A835J8I3_9ROSI|nr:hypothetical protein SADUNF_Sadunf17G0081300 [Salix dunnii]